MLTKRIIPCLDVKGGRVVKGVRFLSLKDAGDPVEVAKAYEKQKADELVFLDITASFEARKTWVRVVRSIAENIFMPFTVGGGIRNLDDIRDLLNAGADKVSINTSAVLGSGLISKAVKRFGSQCIVVAIDAKKVESGRPLSAKKKACWEVFIHGGRTSTGLDVLTWAKKAQRLGAGEILLTSMDFDGTKDGYDIALTRAVSGELKIPVIASGGCGRLEDFYEVFTEGKADAALAASIFHFGQYRIGTVKKYLKSKGINVRI